VLLSRIALLPFLMVISACRACVFEVSVHLVVWLAPLVSYSWVVLLLLWCGFCCLWRVVLVLVVWMRAFLFRCIYHGKDCLDSDVHLPRGAMGLVSDMLTVSWRKSFLQSAHCVSPGLAWMGHMNFVLSTGVTFPFAVLSRLRRLPHALYRSLMVVMFAHILHSLMIFICQSSYLLRSHMVFMMLLSPSRRSGGQQKSGLSRWMLLTLRHSQHVLSQPSSHHTLYLKSDCNTSFVRPDCSWKALRTACSRSVNSF
jgi:hypothetical protein